MENIKYCIFFDFWNDISRWFLKYFDFHPKFTNILQSGWNHELVFWKQYVLGALSPLQVYKLNQVKWSML